MTPDFAIAQYQIEAEMEIRLLRRLVRELYRPACAELGPACEDIAKGYEDVLARALTSN